ncbi:MAG: hypothetical protein ABTR20_13440 [Candidatus Competibacter sp.]
MNGTMTRFWISTAAKAVVGADWTQVKSVVTSLATSALSGPEKRQAALAKLKDLGVSASGALLNFAIEAAVVWLKERAD